MPKELERKLKSEAIKRGLSGPAADRYVYGTMRKTGWKPDKSAASEAFHSLMNSRPA